jgi:hypothetical protein
VFDVVMIFGCEWVFEDLRGREMRVLRTCVCVCVCVVHTIVKINKHMTHVNIQYIYIYIRFVCNSGV